MKKLLEKPVSDTWLTQTTQEALRTQRLLVSFVGAVAILLSPVLVAIDAYAAPACLRNSLSHYYYGQFTGGVFVITLAIIGALLLAYRAEMRWVSWLAAIAGLAAIMVGVFPTTGAGCVAGTFDGRAFVTVTAEAAQAIVTLPANPFSSFDGVQYIHYGAAAVVFGLMFVFCAIIFTAVGVRDRDPETGEILPIKRLCNGVYFACAGLIGVSIVVLLASFLFPSFFVPFPRVVFYGEIVALVSLGIAWLVKGRVFNLSAMGH